MLAGLITVLTICIGSCLLGNIAGCWWCLAVYLHACLHPPLPAYLAAGAREAPLGDTISTSSMRTASDGTSHTGPTTCFPPGLTQQQHQQQDASAAGASPLFSTGSGSTDSPRLGNHAVMDTVTESGGGNAQHPLQVQAQRRSVDLEAQAVLPAHHYQQQQQYSQQQQQQQLCASPSVYSAAGGFTSLASVSAAGGLLGASLGSPLAPPIPPVTMVFMVVEGAKAFGNRRKHLLKEIHAQLSVLLMEALRHVVGGYMCRMQVSSLAVCGCIAWCLQCCVVCGLMLMCEMLRKSIVRVPAGGQCCCPACACGAHTSQT